MPVRLCWYLAIPSKNLQVTRLTPSKSKRTETSHRISTTNQSRYQSLPSPIFLSSPQSCDGSTISTTTITQLPRRLEDILNMSYASSYYGLNLGHSSPPPSPPPMNPSRPRHHTSCSLTPVARRGQITHVSIRHLIHHPSCATLQSGIGD